MCLEMNILTIEQIENMTIKQLKLLCNSYNINIDDFTINEIFDKINLLIVDTNIYKEKIKKLSKIIKKYDRKLTNDLELQFNVGINYLQLQRLLAKHIHNSITEIEKENTYIIKSDGLELELLQLYDHIDDIRKNAYAFKFNGIQDYINSSINSETKNKSLLIGLKYKIYRITPDNIDTCIENMKKKYVELKDFSKKYYEACD
jgi:hypothetical protein